MNFQVQMGQRGAGAGNKSGRHTHPGPNNGTSLPSIAPQQQSHSSGSASLLGKSGNGGLRITPPEQRGRSPSANGRTDWKAKYLK